MNSRVLPRISTTSLRRDNIERLKTALRSVYGDPHIDEVSADDLLGDYPAVQYVPPAGTFHIDVLTRLGDAFRFDDLEISRVPFGPLVVNVVSPRTLYQMKRDTVRLKDKADAQRLRMYTMHPTVKLWLPENTAGRH